MQYSFISYKKDVLKVLWPKKNHWNKYVEYEEDYFKIFNILFIVDFVWILFSIPYI